MSKTTIPTAGLADDAVDLTSKVTGTLPTANGGTGATSFTAGITMADAWRVTSNFTTDNLDPIASTGKEMIIILIKLVQVCPIVLVCLLFQAQGFTQLNLKLLGN